MSKDTKILLAISLTAFVTVVLFIMFIRSATKKEEKAQISTETRQRELVQDELAQKPTGSPEGKSETGAVSKVAIGSKEVSKGNFQKIENGVLFYQDGEVIYTIVLNDVDVVLACTKQDLENATELNYDLISKVKVYTSAEIEDKLQRDTPIVVFAAEMEDGEFKVHTIAIDASKCEK